MLAVPFLPAGDFEGGSKDLGSYEFRHRVLYCAKKWRKDGDVVGNEDGIPEDG